VDFDRLSSALADRYRLERELGAGGMATVWLAEDLRHHRQVAVKVLRPELAASLGPERFHQEVEVAARLQHPHILPLHDSGEADGFLYYVMPYVEGMTLRTRLRKERELPVGEAVRILRDVADAMVEAHARGVIHRDLKPENIMLTGRHAVVADFGVAKAVSEATGKQRLTTAGVAMGTPTYMAPEQATADPLTDHRADIYALGVVAYEMLTGEPPFVRTTAQAMLAAHLTEPPVAVTVRRGTIPAPLATLVMRCLEKKPADRPQRAEEVLAILESLATPSGGVTPTETQPVRVRGSRRKLALAAAGIAAVALVAVGAWALLNRGGPLPDARQREPVVVLPFEVQGGDAALASLGVQAADRITAAIEGASLGAVVRIASAGDGERYTARLGRRVLRETGAGTLVVGTIAQRGDQVEVQAQVVRGSDLTTVWTLGPERAPSTDPTHAMDAIQERVLGALGWYLLGWGSTWENPGIMKPAPSLEVFRLAYRAGGLFLRGQYSGAVPFFRDAFARDTTWFVPALWLAQSHQNQGRAQERESVLEMRRDRLQRGETLYLDFLQALLGSPEDEVRTCLAWFSAEPVWAYLVMWSLVRARRPAEALEYYALGTASHGGLRHDFQTWYVMANMAYHMLGRFEEELELARAAKAQEPRSYGHWAREVGALAALGRADEIERIITASHTLETQGAPVRLMSAAASELFLHGHSDEARGYAKRVVTGLEQYPDSMQALSASLVILRDALRILGRQNEVVRSYEDAGTGTGARGLGERILGMRDRILLGDTVGAMALVDSARIQPLTAYMSISWATKGVPLYHAAGILSLLGRKDEAVAMLREALNNGYRLGADEPLYWYWAPIKDYPPFQELVRVR